MKHLELVVRLENRFDNFFDVKKALKDRGIGIWSCVIDSDGVGFGSMRILTPFVNKAKQILMKMHEHVKCDVSEVVLIEDAEAFERLAEAREAMTRANVTIKRLYNYQGQSDPQTIVVKFNDNDKAIKLLRIKNWKIGYTRPKLLEKAA